jgi:glycosyltransferase involved in cell wall biosynthesis
MANNIINIIFTIDNLLIGGAQELVKTLALNLNKNLFNVSVCSLIHCQKSDNNEPLADEIRAKGIDVVKLNMKSWSDSEEKTKFIKLLRDKEIDIIHAHLYPADLWACRLAQSAGVPVKVYTKHETYHNKPLHRRVVDACFYNYYMDKAIAISDISDVHLKKYEFVNPFRVCKIFNPVDTEKFDPAQCSGTIVRDEFKIPLSAPVIGNVARFVARKGINFFIETAAKVLQEVPEAFFILVGYGEDESKLKKMTANRGISDHFIFTGPRRDIPNLLAAMDIFLFTPLSGESLPIALLEALSMGKTIVASNVCSNREIISHEISGLLPTPRHWSLTAENLDTDILADSVIGLIKSSSTREAFGKMARKRAQDIFSISTIMRQVENLYTSLYLEKSGK